MHPILLHFGPFVLSSYTTCIALAFLAAFVYSSRECDRRGLDRLRVTNLQFLILLAGLAGSHFLAVLLHWRSYASSPGLAFAFWLPAGRVFYGGLLLATVTAIVYCRMAGLPVGVCADIAAPAVALAQSIGRIGCLLGGCCYGRPCDLPWCFAIPVYSSDLVVRRHPTQLYESLAMLLVFWMLHRYLRRKDRPDGVVLAAYGISYGVVRFVVESFRGDLRTDWLSSALSPSQWISVAIFGAGLAAFRLQAGAFPGLEARPAPTAAGGEAAGKEQERATRAN